MSDRLEKLLEPGERVIYRARGAWVPPSWPIIIIPGLLFALGHSRPVVDSALLPCAVAFLAVLLFLAWQGAVQQAAGVLVTDRRLLTSHGWLSPEIRTMALSEIRRVEFTSQLIHASIRVSAGGAAPLLISEPGDLKALAAKLAQGAGLPAPPAIGARAHGTITSTLYIGWLVGYLVLVMGFVRLPYEAIGALLQGWQAAILIPALLAGAGGWLVAMMLFATVLSMVLARPFVAAEDMALWLDLREEHADGGRFHRWFRQASRKIATWTWGRPMGGGNAQVHGGAAG